MKVSGTRWIAEAIFALVAVALPLASFSFGWPGGAWWIAASALILVIGLVLVAAISKAPGWQQDFALERSGGPGEGFGLPASFRREGQHDYIDGVILLSPSEIRLYSSPYSYYCARWSDVLDVSRSESQFLISTRSDQIFVVAKDGESEILSLALQRRT